MFAKLFEIKGRQLLLTMYGDASPFRDDPAISPERTIHVQCEVSDTVAIYAQILAPSVKKAQDMYHNMNQEQAEEIMNRFSEMYENGENHIPYVNTYSKLEDNKTIH